MHPQIERRLKALEEREEAAQPPLYKDLNDLWRSMTDTTHPAYEATRKSLTHFYADLRTLERKEQHRGA